MVEILRFGRADFVSCECFVKKAQTWYNLQDFAIHLQAECEFLQFCVQFFAQNVHNFIAF